LTKILLDRHDVLQAEVGGTNGQRSDDDEILALTDESISGFSFSAGAKEKHRLF
jgi:hypothetical protein